MSNTSLDLGDLSNPETPIPSTVATPKNRSQEDIQLTDQTNLLPFKKVLPIFLGLALCIVISALDSVIVATALPSISTAFNAGSVISWVPSAYLLTSTSFQASDIIHDCLSYDLLNESAIYSPSTVDYPIYLVAKLPCA